MDEQDNIDEQAIKNLQLSEDDLDSEALLACSEWFTEILSKVGLHNC